MNEFSFFYDFPPFHDHFVNVSTHSLTHSYKAIAIILRQMPKHRKFGLSQGRILTLFVVCLVFCTVYLYIYLIYPCASAIGNKIYEGYQFSQRKKNGDVYYVINVIAVTLYVYHVEFSVAFSALESAWMWWNAFHTRSGWIRGVLEKRFAPEQKVNNRKRSTEKASLRFFCLFLFVCHIRVFFSLLSTISSFSLSSSLLLPFILF